MSQSVLFGGSKYKRRNYRDGMSILNYTQIRSIGINGTYYIESKHILCTIETWKSRIE